MDYRERLAELEHQRSATAKSSPHGWWYHAKKRHALFPGVRTASRPDLLANYYDHWQAQLSPPRIAANAITFAAFRRFIPVRTRKVAARFGLDQSWQNYAVAMARKHFMDPYELALFRSPCDAELGDYLRSFEWNRITKLINPRQWQTDCVLAHKIDFQIYATHRELPVPEMHAVIQDGEPFVLSLPRGNALFCKPEGGRGGIGAFRLRIAPGDVTSDDALTNRLRKEPRLAQGEWIVQEVIGTHADLRDIALGALPTLRLNTMLNEEGVPEIVTAFLRVAADAQAVADNTELGGLVVPLDQVDGTMKAAFSYKTLEEMAHHPVSGAVIERRAIPLFREAGEMVLDAHRDHFARYTLIAWDIAMTDDGPVVIEANGKPGAQGTQAVERCGLGKLRMGELVAWHLAQATDG